MGSDWDLYFKNPETTHNSEQSGRVRFATTSEEAHVYTMADPIWGIKQFAMDEATAFSLFYRLLPTANIQPVDYLMYVPTYHACVCKPASPQKLRAVAFLAGHFLRAFEYQQVPEVQT